MTATLQTIATAVQRVQAAFKRRPEAGLHDDPPALSQWQGGTRVVTSHADGVKLLTDMPPELAGSGDQVTPGWLFRAGLAACATTSIVLMAAAEGVELTALDVQAGSRSDARGLLGMNDEAGQPVHAGPLEVHLTVRIHAPTATPAQLRALVQRAIGCSPIPSMVGHPTPLTLQFDSVGA